MKMFMHPQECLAHSCLVRISFERRDRMAFLEDILIKISKDVKVQVFGSNNFRK
jgi:hypothetical protein